MKRTMAIAVILFLSAHVASAQLRSITAASDYSMATGKRMNVETASAVGGATLVRFGITEEMTLGISLGYKMYSISQKDQLTAWNWDFWNNRYSITIRSNIQADPNLSVQVGSVQKIDMVPVALHADHTFRLGESITVTPSFAAGAVYFSRRLFAIETWTKRFPAANYSFTYSYRNFAPEKSGTVFSASPGLSVAYRLFDAADVTLGVRYQQYVAVKGMVGAAEFPLDNELNISLGLDFPY
jgi:hypothetical protein